MAPQLSRWRRSQFGERYMALELYIISGSPHAWAVMLGMEIKELKYTTQRLDPSKKEHKTGAYYALNPHGKVPTLKHDNTVIYESIAIHS